MKKLTTKALVIAVAAGSAHMAQAADNLGDALKETKASGAFNLRYEDVDLQGGSALTLRSRITVSTGTVGKFSAVAGFEDVRDILGVDDKSGIADPEVTEVDQAYLQYKSGDSTVKLGRQVIALDNQRFVGHVGWRQDRQTFDALNYTDSFGEDFNVNLSYVYKYNRIFAEAADFDANTFLLNASYTSVIGKLTGSAYLLDNRDNAAPANNSDTLGLRLTGSIKGDLPINYVAEYALQDAGVFDADYLRLEVGSKFSGLSVNLGYESLGSDSANGVSYGFSTPLATLHAHNGWVDSFLGTPTSGLTDAFLSLSGKIGPVSLVGVYHDFGTDVGSGSASEIDLQASVSLGGGVTSALKYADIDGDTLTADNTRVWLSFSYGF